LKQHRMFLETAEARDAWLYDATNGAWAEASARFVEASPGPIESFTPFADPVRTFAQTEVDSALRSGAPTVEGFLRNNSPHSVMR